MEPLESERAQWSSIGVLCCCLPAAVLLKGPYLRAVNFTWELSSRLAAFSSLPKAFLLRHQHFFSGELRSYTHAVNEGWIWPAMQARARSATSSNDITWRGVNDWQDLSTPGYVFIYLSVLFSFLLFTKCTFACLNEKRGAHNTNNVCNHHKPLVTIKSQEFSWSFFPSSHSMVLQVSSPLMRATLIKGALLKHHSNC